MQHDCYLNARARYYTYLLPNLGIHIVGNPPVQYAQHMMASQHDQMLLSCPLCDGQINAFFFSSSSTESAGHCRWMGRLVGW